MIEAAAADPIANTVDLARYPLRALGSSTGRALIADVAVAPSSQGKGFGRVVLVGTVRALRERGSTAIALVVTEGNRRAVRLYERLGFVRTLGPTREWYNTRQIPVRSATG